MPADWKAEITFSAESLLQAIAIFNTLSGEAEIQFIKCILPSPHLYSKTYHFHSLLPSSLEAPSFIPDLSSSFIDPFTNYKTLVVFCLAMQGDCSRAWLKHTREQCFTLEVGFEFSQSICSSEKSGYVDFLNDMGLEIITESQKCFVPVTSYARVFPKEQLHFAAEFTSSIALADGIYKLEYVLRNIAASYNKGAILVFTSINGQDISWQNNPYDTVRSFLSPR